MHAQDLDQLNARDYIIVKGAKVNNLKDLSVAIPRNKLVVITGVSGSGKSSLAFDTLFAEGQRMYVESLNSYARQFLGRMEKPEVEYIRGVSPAIAVEQKVNTRNPRSTVGTVTEVYDYLKLLFARIGRTYSPVSGLEVRKDTVTSVTDFVCGHPVGTRLMILCPLRIREGRSIAQELNILLQKGFARVSIGDEILLLEEALGRSIAPNADIRILIDRAAVQPEEEFQYRISDSVQTAFQEGEGDCIVEIFSQNSDKQIFTFSDRFEADGLSFEEPSVNLFSFNNPYGACRTCEGFGTVLGIDEDLVIPDKGLSVYEGAIMPWRGNAMSRWVEPLLRNGILFDFPIHRAIHDLTPDEYQLLWTGNKYFEGLHAFFEYVESQAHKIQYRVMAARYRGRTTCPDCRGSRLRKDAGYVKISGKSIIDISLMSIAEVTTFFGSIELPANDAIIAQRLLTEIRNRLGFLEKVGLGYLTLHRLANTLSGGEFQRIKLATSLSSALVGSMYILDEPSIGLHPRDTHNLVQVLQELRDLGNTVIVVEHEEEAMRAADQIIDIGPDAGTQGGALVFQGTIADINPSVNSHTARYLTGQESIEVPASRRPWSEAIEIKGAREHNLKNIHVRFPLGVLTVVTGVSGSGKSTLVKSILHPALGKLYQQVAQETGKFDRLDGDTKRLTTVEFVDQNPIGKSSRSNPVTYVKAYDLIRQLYAEQALSVQRGYAPAHFSFNVPGGRCDLCEGEGRIKIEMQFMADIWLTCESCKGRRFKDEILDVKWNDKAIHEVLDMTIDEAVVFFQPKPRIVERLMPLKEVGLGYIRLGQSSATLSGGEAQRVKLASFLVKGNVGANDRILFIFDEPTTGLHFHDIKKLLYSINALIERGHTVVIIEHNMEVIKCADWIIDLGPEGGQQGGHLCFEGTPEEMIGLRDNHTARFLRDKLAR